MIISRAVNKWFVALALIFTLGIAVTFTYAQSGPTTCTESATQKCLPGTVNKNAIRQIQGINLSNGLNVNGANPTAVPELPASTVPTLSGINTPWAMNSDGPVEFIDDTVIHGIFDIRQGFTNGKPATPVGTLNITSPGPNPVSMQTSAGRGLSAFQLAVNLSNTSAETVTISKLTFTKTGTAPDNIFSEVRIYSPTPYTEYSLTQPTSPGVFTFLTNFQLPPGGNRDWILLITTGRNAVVGTNATFALSNVEVKDAAGTRTLLMDMPALPYSVGTVTVIPGLVVGNGPYTHPNFADKNSSVNTIDFDLFAGGADATISKLALTRLGTATNADVPSISMFDMNTTSGTSTPITNAQNIQPNASGFYSATGLNISIPSGTNKIILIKANVSGTAVTGHTMAWQWYYSSGITTTLPAIDQGSTGTSYTIIN